MKGIIYTRVSSDEQIKGTSLEFQDELCRKYCEQRGIEVVALYKDEGETAKDLSLNNRKKFLEALEFCRKNKGLIQAFIVLRVDRFARNTEDHFAVRKILMDFGVTLHSVTEPIGNNPSEKFIETVLAGAAEYDNAIRKQRCSDGMQSRIKQGICPWHPPIGYACIQAKKHGEKKIYPDEPDEQAFPIVQKGLKYFSQGLCSLTELGPLLDEWGLKSLRGQKTSVQLVDKILGKYLKFYAGIVHNPWTNEDFEGLHKPMITKEEMYKIEMIRSGKNKLIRHQQYNPDFPLRRTVVCAACKRPLTGSSPRGNGGRYAYYHCQNKNCQAYGKSISKQNLEKEFMDYLAFITPKEEFLSLFKETVLDLWQERGKLFAVEAKRCESRLAGLEEKKKHIYEMREDGTYTKEEFIERKQAIENEITSAKISASEAKIDLFDIEGALAYATNFISNLGRQWFDLPPNLKQQFQKLVFPEGIPYQKDFGFGTAQLGLIFKLNQHFLGADLSQNSTLVHHLRTN